MAAQKSSHALEFYVLEGLGGREKYVTAGKIYKQCVIDRKGLTLRVMTHNTDDTDISPG